MSETNAMGVAQKQNQPDTEGVQNSSPGERADQGPFSTPERAKRTKLMMLVGASVCIFILMVVVKVGGT